MTIMGSRKPFITLLVCTPSIIWSFSQLTFLSFFFFFFFPSPPRSQLHAKFQLGLVMVPWWLKHGKGRVRRVSCPSRGCSSGLQVSRTGTDRKKTGLSRGPSATALPWSVLHGILHRPSRCFITFQEGVLLSDGGRSLSSKRVCFGEQTAIP